MRSRRDAFDDLVLEAADRVGPALERRGACVDFAVEEVPPAGPAPWEEQAAPLGRLVPPQGREAARVVVYRRPVEARARDSAELADLVEEVVVEQLSAYLGVPPTDLDP